VTELNPFQKDAVGRAAHLQEDIRRFQSDWPTLNSIHDMAPQFSWSQLTRQLSSLSANPANAALAPDLISATRKLAPFKPPEMVLREILSIACALMDETFPSDLETEDSASPDSEDDPMA
jgi:hypothetical protein